LSSDAKNKPFAFSKSKRHCLSITMLPLHKTMLPDGANELWRHSTMFLSELRLN